MKEGNEKRGRIRKSMCAFNGNCKGYHFASTVVCLGQDSTTYPGSSCNKGLGSVCLVLFLPHGDGVLGRVPEQSSRMASKSMKNKVTVLVIQSTLYSTMHCKWLYTFASILEGEAGELNVVVHNVHLLFSWCLQKSIELEVHRKFQHKWKQRRLIRFSNKGVWRRVVSSCARAAFVIGRFGTIHFCCCNLVTSARKPITILLHVERLFDLQLQ